MAWESSQQPGSGVRGKGQGAGCILWQACCPDLLGNPGLLRASHCRGGGGKARAAENAGREERKGQTGRRRQGAVLNQTAKARCSTRQSQNGVEGSKWCAAHAQRTHRTRRAQRAGAGWARTWPIQEWADQGGNMGGAGGVAAWGASTGIPRAPRSDCAAPPERTGAGATACCLSWACRSGRLGGCVCCHWLRVEQRERFWFDSAGP